MSHLLIAQKPPAQFLPITSPSAKHPSIVLLFSTTNPPHIFFFVSVLALITPLAVQLYIPASFLYANPPT